MSDADLLCPEPAIPISDMEWNSLRGMPRKEVAKFLHDHCRKLRRRPRTMNPRRLEAIIRSIEGQNKARPSTSSSSEDTTNADAEETSSILLGPAMPRVSEDTTTTEAEETTSILGPAMPRVFTPVLRELPGRSTRLRSASGQDVEVVGARAGVLRGFRRLGHGGVEAVVMWDDDLVESTVCATMLVMADTLAAHGALAPAPGVLDDIELDEPETPSWVTWTEWN